MLDARRQPQTKAIGWKQKWRKRILNDCLSDLAPRRLAFGISMLYLAVGALWILLSDKLVLDFVTNPRLSSTISMTKGWLYVVVTAVMLYAVIELALSSLQVVHRQLILKYEELALSEQKLQQMAFEDYLTNLPNRAAFYQRAQRHLDANPDGQTALMFIDIDNFKYINDTLGHAAGDKLIAAIGKRLCDLSDAGKSIYRIGGDEFVVFAHRYRGIEEIEAYAEALLCSFGSPFHIDEHLLNVTVSVGIALHPLHGGDVDALLKCADIAMYKAKGCCRGRYIFYHRDMDMQVQERMMMENELWKALERGEFHLCYQPQLDVETGKIHSMEALLRWENEKLGSASPLKFIRIAEETNLINPIGDWVLENACLYLRELQTAGHDELTMSVNVSGIQLLQPTFTQKVIDILANTGVEPRFVVLEITESVLIEFYDEIKDKLAELKARGINIALDDFGTGYSSLSYLAHIPINTLKIDKIFIDTIAGQGEDSLIGLIILLGRKLGLSIVAEGVETQQQLQYLQQHQCHKIQGFYFSKPLSREGMAQLLANPIVSVK